MKKFYLNPFEHVFTTLDSADPVCTTIEGSLGCALLDEVGLLNLLATLYMSDVCVGKFDFFNKWGVYKVPDTTKLPKDLREKIDTNLKHVYHKPFAKCPRCKHYRQCSVITIPRQELISFWPEIYKTRGQLFKK